VGDALAALAQDSRLADLLERLPVRMAVNRELVGEDTPLHAGDELALLPPVSGGAGPDVRVSETRSRPRMSPRLCAGPAPGLS